MKQDRLMRHLIIAFALSLALYVTLFWLIERRRVVQTPWVVRMESDGAGLALVEISQESLGLGPVRIQIQGATSPPLASTRIEFASPKPFPRPLPLGECLFEDLTFFPGTVVLKVADAKIQMLPRALTIGTNEFGWSTSQSIAVERDGTCRMMK